MKESSYTFKCWKGCSSSVVANYRPACRAKSKEEFDESMFFLELLNEFNPDFRSVILNSWKEANELLSIIVAALGTLRKSDTADNRNSKIVNQNEALAKR
ncbi:hypothetical protein [Desertivirga xinjiangensis]|uniref:hypothetical protein n=1 Tax=Desertivirga xinjiangensis TaxID=539206 RepID=UPI00210C9689|nr:hypothetical protein [Pedobacter xinjiangensis]